MSADEKPPAGSASTLDAPERAAPSGVPRLPVRASIYIDPDGSVHFGALFEGLVPVAEALRGKPGPDAATAGATTAAGMAEQKAGARAAAVDPTGAAE